MHPVVEVSINGQPVAGGFYERLVSLSVTDKEGVTSDSFQMDLNDGPPSFLALPATGSAVSIRLGHRETGVRSAGLFTLDKVTGKCLPYGLSLSGKSADLGRGSLKENKERHWDGKTLGEIVRQIASDAGLSASVDASLAAHRYDWLAQQDESDIHFLERIARRHNGIFSIKNGKLLFSERGSSRSAGGAFLGTVVITPDIIIQNTCSFEANDRTKYSKVVAYYQDKEEARRVEIEADSGGDSDSVFRIPEPFADVAEADKAAQAKAKQLKRGEGSTSVSIVGDTSVVAGAALLYRNVRPGLDGVPYVIDTVTQTYSKTAGFITKIDGKLFDGRSRPSKSAGSGDGEPAESGGGSAAPDSPSGTPSVPSGWASLVRNGGLTDGN